MERWSEGGEKCRYGGGHEKAEGRQKCRRGGGHGEAEAGTRKTSGVTDRQTGPSMTASKHKLIREEGKKERIG